LHRYETDHECDGQTDRRTDGQTDALTMAKTREALHAVARNKQES